VKLNQTFDGFKRTWVEVLAIVKDDGLVDIRMISDLGPYMDPGLMHKVVQFMQDNVYPDCL